MNILGTLTVTQKSQDGTIVTVDKHAERLLMGDAYRYSYMEKSGAHILLDISGNQVSLRRRDQGLTQALFDKDESTLMQVHTEDGMIEFTVKVLHLDIQEENMSLHYDILHQDEVVGHHEFNMDWKAG